MPIPLPGPISPGATTTINYCFSLCLATDSPGANSMRNVVAVTASVPGGTAKTFTTRSVSFAPPRLDCQACCLPDGSCTDTVPASCGSASGLSRGSGTDCATTECPQACCSPDGNCTDEGPSVCSGAGGEPSGPGTNCASTQCCAPLGSAGCTAATECCGTNSICKNDACCIDLGTTGCAVDSECCGLSAFDHHDICEAGRCCAPTGRDFACNEASDCCNPIAVCAGSDHTCCIPIGTSGCTNSFDCCPGLTIFDDGAICEAGRCCAPIGRSFLCDSDSDCCGNGICAGSDHSCCLPMFRSGCTSDFDCCPGLFCDAGTCQGVISP